MVGGIILEKENLILSKLKEKFPGFDCAADIPFERRIYMDVPSEIFLDLIGFAASELGFDHLCTITGMDSGDCFEFVYHISDHNGIVLNLKLKAPKENPVISTVLPIFNGATFYELELEGLLGVKVNGLKAGRQYPLPDNWPKDQYPLRKDWVPGNAKIPEGGA